MTASSNAERIRALTTKPSSLALPSGGGPRPAPADLIGPQRRWMDGRVGAIRRSARLRRRFEQGHHQLNTANTPPPITRPFAERTRFSASPHQLPKPIPTDKITYQWPAPTGREALIEALPR